MSATTPPPLVAAVAQIETELGDLAANAKKHRDVIADARRAGVDVLLFPELSLVGHSSGCESLRLALGRNDALLAELADLTGDMCTVVGFIEEAPAAQFYNAAAALRHGRVEFVHRKINLATYGRLEEGKHFASGRRMEAFSLAPEWRAGVLICADLWNPALVHLAAGHGATVLLGPISSAVEAVGPEFDNPGGWNSNLRFYAMTYGAPVVAANRVGREGDLTFWGGSRILDAFGHTLAAADGANEQLVVAELDYAVLRRARYLLPTVRDSNLELIGREIDRLSRA